MSLFTKRERSLIFSALKKSSFISFTSVSTRKIIPILFFTKISFSSASRQMSPLLMFQLTIVVVEFLETVFELSWFVVWILMAVVQLNQNTKILILFLNSNSELNQIKTVIADYKND